MTFKVVDGTEPTRSMPMLVANGHRLENRGEDTMLCTAAGDGDDWYLKVLINNENVFIRIDVWAACHECPPSWVRCLSPENVERRTTPASTTITRTREGFEVKNSSSPEQTGAAGKRRNTMPEDVDEPMPAKPWCDHAESAIPPSEGTDIAAVHSVFDAQNLSLFLSRDEEIEVLRSLSSWNPGGGAYDNSTSSKTGKGKSIQKRQRPREVNTVLAFAGGGSRSEIPAAPNKNPKSETMTSTLDDAELLKDLRGLGKPPLFDENDTDASFFPVSEDDLILLRHVDDVVDTSPDKCHRHRAIRETANPSNQHIEMPKIRYTDKVADDFVAVPRQISPRTTETKAPEHQWDDRSGGDANKDVQGEAITKYCWSDGKNTVSIYLELGGLDDVTDDAFKVESGKSNVSLTIASVAGKQRIFKLAGLAHAITGQSSPEERKTDGFPEAREKGKEDLAQVAR